MIKAGKNGGGKMKGRIRAFCMAFLMMLLCMPVWADVGSGPKTDYHTDYYMIVESKNGGIHIYADADQRTSRLNKDMILNGTSFHIRGEKTDEKGNAWGLTEYHGMNGFVRLDELKPVTLTEAIQSEFSGEEIKDVDYEYNVSCKEENAKFYRGPGEKYGEVSSLVVHNGERVHISKEVSAEDGILWGKVTGREKNGWIKMDKIQEEISATPVPSVSPKITKTKEVSVQAADGVSELFMNPILWIVAAGMFLVLIFLYFLKLK